MKLALFDRHTDAEIIESIWNTLNSVGNQSFFLSWGWMKNWLQSLPQEVDVHLAVIFDNDNPVAAFFMGDIKVVRKHIFRSRFLSMNETGVPHYDALYIEYNSILNSDPVKCRLKNILDLLPEPWDEFMMAGLDGNAFPASDLHEATDHIKVTIVRDDPSPYVDLEKVRGKGLDYLSLLNSNTRYQIRRSYNKYTQKGDLHLETAVDLQKAIDFFHEMIDLHQKTWQSRNEPGAFASGYFRTFHHKLILDRFDKDEIQLLRITCGGNTIGILYNFVYLGTVYFYQSGIKYDPDPHIKPGLVCHVEAILHNAREGQNIYDFLAGGDQYKKSLSTGQNRLIWAKVQKPHLKFEIENKLKSIKRSIRKRIDELGN